MAESLESQIDTVADWLASSSSTVFLGGAGVSTESGIPDFRSSEGIYTKLREEGKMLEPEYLLSHDCLVNDTDIFFEYQRSNRRMGNLEPNVTHRVLARLEDEGALAAVITQNIDGLHQKAGSKTVWELHGSQMRHLCMGPAEHRFSSTDIPDEPLIPLCPECGNTIRPDVVLFGEMLDPRVTDAAMDAVGNADMLIVAGTSLNVYPAAGLLNFYAGDRLVLMNRDATPMDYRADIVMHHSLGEVFSEIARRRWPDDYEILTRHDQKS